MTTQHLKHLFNLDSHVDWDEGLCHLDEHLDVKVALDKLRPFHGADIYEETRGVEDVKDFRSVGQENLCSFVIGGPASFLHKLLISILSLLRQKNGDEPE